MTVQAKSLGFARLVGSFVTLIVVLSTVSTTTATAAESAWWHVTSELIPGTLFRGGEGQVLVVVSNLGNAAASGATVPVRVTDVLPAGLTATSVNGIAGAAAIRGEPECSVSPLECKYTGPLPPYERLEITITVKVAENARSGDENKISVVGGGVPGTSATQPVTVGTSPTPFGVEKYEFLPENEGGSLDTQAGSHPFQFTTFFSLNQTTEAAKPPALTKDLHFNLPPGFVGNPTPFPQCNEVQFASIKTFGENLCPADTAIGVAVVTVDEPSSLGLLTLPVPVFNLVPQVGEPARFGFFALDDPVVLDTSVRTGSDYGVTASVNNISQSAAVLASQVTFWGTPGDPSHNAVRGTGCIDGELLGGSCTPEGLSISEPFLTLPTSCSGPLQTTVEAESWPSPANPNGITLPPVAPTSTVSLDSCNRLSLNPAIDVAPDVQSASTPTGLTVKVQVPQGQSLAPKGLAQSAVRSTTVALPEGLTVNPAGADGLEGCSEPEIGFKEIDAMTETALFTPTLPVPFCPDASKIGTVRIKTPLLPSELVGAVYLASPAPLGEAGENPFDSLISVYIVAEDPVAGVLVKLPGEVKLTSVGELVSTFKNTPQLPFEELEVHFFGGARAPLSTPPLCKGHVEEEGRPAEEGYRTNAVIAPWSGNPPEEHSSEFDITTGPGGGPCPNGRPFSPSLSQLPFAPSLTAQATNIQAGGFSPFTMTMTREDGNQNLKAIKLHMPPGLLGTLSKVKLCEEPQADEGTCGPESEIGQTIVSVGLGGDPFTVTGGKVFVTGPYEGAPYGLSIVNPAKAGPFDLGKVVVRAKIEVDPQTAELTVTTDSSGSYAIPQMLKGIPLQIKHVNVTVDRQGFTFNPTNCNPLAITGTLTSAQEATSALKVPFQVTDCAALAFKPKFTISTSAHHTRADGASLDVKLTYPNTPQGTETNIARAKVQLPKRLPSRLTTLQKACTEAVFDANPAKCPADSMVGSATLKTPVIPVTLNGPAYFVSHGNAKFPELIVVLQGDNVTIELHGETFISKKGITTSTFGATPDAPFSSFELKLPEGPYSALAANGNLCKGTLTIPTEFVAQDGAKINQKTKIAVTGCPKKVKHHKKTTKKGKKK
jgi:uncharacterized repeat protein (TIGR01451 family)